MERGNPSSISTTNTQSNMSNFDNEFKYLCTHYFYVNGNNHHIRLMLDQNGVHLFKDFMRCDKDDLKTLKRKKNNAFISLNSLNVKKIYDAILYYEFMRTNGDKTMTAHPDQWVMKDLEDWIDRDLPKSNVAYATSLAGNTTTTLPGTTPISANKKAEGAWMS